MFFAQAPVFAAGPLPAPGKAVVNIISTDDNVTLASGVVGRRARRPLALRC